MSPGSPGYLSVRYVMSLRLASHPGTSKDEAASLLAGIPPSAAGIARSSICPGWRTTPALRESIILTPEQPVPATANADAAMTRASEATEAFLR